MVVNDKIVQTDDGLVIGENDGVVSFAPGHSLATGDTIALSWFRDVITNTIWYDEETTINSLTNKDGVSVLNHYEVICNDESGNYIVLN